MENNQPYIKNPINGILVLIYINTARQYKRKDNSQVIYGPAYIAGQNAFVCLLFNIMTFGLPFLVFDLPGSIYIIISVSICLLYFFNNFKYFNNSKYYFKQTVNFFRYYRNKESLIKLHYRLYVYFSFLIPVITFIIVMILKKNNII